MELIVALNISDLLVVSLLDEGKCRAIKDVSAGFVVQIESFLGKFVVGHKANFRRVNLDAQLSELASGAVSTQNFKGVH